MPVVAVLHHLDHPFLGHAGPPLLAEGIDLDERSHAGGDPLPELDAIDGLVVLGGDQSLAGETDVLAAPTALVRAAVQRGVPVLGVCLGAQMLARALGGSVRHVGRVVEWRDLTPLPAAAEDPVFAALPAPVPALHWNEDVLEPPPGAVELLARAADGAEAFRAGAAAWGVQYHPDVDPAALERWIDEFGHQVAETGVDPEALRAESERRMAVQAQASRVLFGAFGRFVAGRAAAKAAA